MKKVLILLAILSLLLAFAVGCGKKAEETEQAPVEVQQTEQVDTTAVDTTMVDTTAVDTTAPAEGTE